MVLDLGAGALNRLQDEVAPESLDALVITHVHPDHCADMLALRIYMAFGPGRGRRLRVLGPRDLPDRLVAFTGPELWEAAFRFEALPEGGGAQELAPGLVLRHAEVPHHPPTFALRLEWEGRAVCFGADCSENDALVELARGCDLLVLECSQGATPVPPGLAHLGAAEAARIARRAGAARVLLTHCYPEHDRDAALARARADLGDRVGWARQGEVVPV